MAADHDFTVALLATPWARLAGRHLQRSFLGQQRKYKASEDQLRASDVSFISDSLQSLPLSVEEQQSFNGWLQTGIWPNEKQCVIGAVCLRRPLGLQHMGVLDNQEKIVLWHAWGCPRPHYANPQLLLFEVVRSICFQQQGDFRAFATNMKVSEQRSSWTIRLPQEVLQQLHQAMCCSGRPCQTHFQEWGVPDGQAEFPVFTSLGPIVLLVARDKWHTLADLPRCTPELLRRPRGREGIVSHEVWLQGFGLEISMFQGLCDVSCCLSIFILQLQATAHCGSKGFLHE